jgi:hypothetical protein
MPKTRVIVPTTNPKDGTPLAAGAEVDLDDESYNALRQQGAVEASEQEQKEHATPEAQGNYSQRTGRVEAGGRDADDHPHGGPPGQTGDHPQGGPPGQDKPRADQGLPEQRRRPDQDQPEPKGKKT